MPLAPVLLVNKLTQKLLLPLRGSKNLVCIVNGGWFSLNGYAKQRTRNAIPNSNQSLLVLFILWLPHMRSFSGYRLNNAELRAEVDPTEVENDAQSQCKIYGALLSP